MAACRLKPAPVMCSPTARQAQLPRRVVLGLDAEGVADAAVHVGLELSNALDASLVIVHALAPRSRFACASGLVGAEEPVARLSRAARAARARLQGIAWSAGLSHLAPDERLRVVCGRPAQVLLAQSRSASDLVMLGAQRLTGALRFGSTVRTLLTKATGPVWVHRDAAVRIRRMLVPIDMTLGSMFALGLAIAIASKLGARVDVLHSFPMPYSLTLGSFVFSMQDLRHRSRCAFEESLSGLDWSGVPHTQTFVDGEPLQSIVDRSEACDLIVMGRRERPGLAATIFGNTALRVLERSDKPLLVTHSCNDENARTMES